MKENQQHELLFLNPIRIIGLNVTIRRGDKWYKKGNIGDGLNIYKTGDTNYHNRIAFAKIVGLAYLPFCLIPQDFLDKEHDPECHNLYGLLKAMKQAYPDFQTKENITVIIFEFVKSGD